ncbi:MAG: hypothetical protein KF901_03640 [Myxococcales bacterium]|nr:hypothetical protein [Myxococcales bacterium]
MAERTSGDGRREPRALVADERGAMMLLGIFMATILVGLLYYVAGLGETITYRERMQDAADTAAYGGALLHARAMNVIALLNMTVASIFAVGVAAQAAIFLVAAAAGAAARECGPFNPGACLAAVCLTLIGIPDACGNADSKRSVARDVAQNAQSAARDLARATQLAAIGAAHDITTTRYAPPVSEAIALVGAIPIEDEDPSRACDEVLSFNGPSGGAGDMPLLVTADFAVREARRIASSCGAERYVNAGLGVPLTWLACPMVREDVDGRTQRVREGVRMGGSEFQLRVIARAGADAMPLDPNQERVSLLTWGQPDESGGLGRTADLLRDGTDLAVAQAEYYFDGDVDRGLWTWRMQWRARLRRIRAGGGGLCPPGVPGCGGLEQAFIH